MGSKTAQYSFKDGQDGPNPTQRGSQNDPRWPQEDSDIPASFPAPLPFRSVCPGFALALGRMKPFQESPRLKTPQKTRNAASTGPCPTWPSPYSG